MLRTRKNASYLVEEYFHGIVVRGTVLQCEVVEFLHRDDALVRGVAHAEHGPKCPLAENTSLLVGFKDVHAGQDTRVGLVAVCRTSKQRDLTL